jgi:uncharacterized iron-regulated membrane protein
MRLVKEPQLPAFRIRLRSLWFSVHKWIGLLLAVLIVPISLSGSALVWHDALDAALNPEREARSGSPGLPLDAYLASARRGLDPHDRIASIALPEDEGAVIVVGARAPNGGGGRPVRTTLWLDPADGRVLDKAGGNEGLVRMLHVLHGSLMVPGVGRQIVGWVGVFMLISSLTGLWLWWPTLGGLRRGLRWRRQDTANANLHHTTGFWIALPLALLSFTGVWISFPGIFGGNAPAPAAAKAPRPSGPPLPLAETRLDPTTAGAIAVARGGGRPATIAWPTSQSPQWTVTLRGADGPSEYKLDDSTAEARPQPPRPETTARKMRRWHDGDGMGIVWQILIFLGGIGPAVLAVTGIVMWLRTRRWRGDAGKRKGA